MHERHSVVEFSLHPVGQPPVAVRLRRYLDRWVAELIGTPQPLGIGLTAREALTAALAPLGEVTVRLLLADLGLLEPSIRVAAIEQARDGAA